MGGDDKKILEEVRRLQAEVNSLRSENSQLKVSPVSYTHLTLPTKIGV